jgi:predicted metalloprotease
MRWRGGRRSRNVEDRRGQGAGVPGYGRGMPRVRLGGRGGKISGLGFLLIIVLMLVFGVNPATLFQDAAPPDLAPRQPVPDQSFNPRAGGQDELADFVSVVLADTEDTWAPIFRQLGGTYQPPTLVLFNDVVQSACGFAQAAVGPFYCPVDQKVYIDLAFYDELRSRFQAPGDFAQAYVIAHEVGHHVQNLLGVASQVQELRSQLRPEDANRLTVRMELQADCFAGIWANHAERARQILEEGDIEEALNAASAIGDDRIQRQSRGYVTPDSFTHGTSEQRMRWFTRGLRSGSLENCDTFSADRL